MTRLWFVPLLVACGGGPKPAPTEPVDSGAWVTHVRTWYCGVETIPPKAAGEAPGERAFIVKLAPTAESFAGLYAVREGARNYIGTLTKFSAAGDRVATLAAENDDRQKGPAKATFTPDFQGLTLEWQVGSQPAVTSTTLTAVDAPTACAAGTLLR